MEKNKLYEYRSYSQAGIVLEESRDPNSSEKTLCMKGLFIQGDIRNQNQRVYPAREIARAVNEMSKKIVDNGGIWGEIDHPAELSINLDRISHVITEMWMDGTDGYGKLKILQTPMGNIIKVLLQSGAKLGVSSRGSGNVGDDGVVSDFEIVTVDIVAQPSAPNAYPRAIYESLYNMKGGSAIYETAKAAVYDPRAEQYLVKDLSRFIGSLGK